MLRKLYPNLYLKSVTDIDIDILIKNNIRGVLLDVDNTLIDSFNKPILGLDKWIQGLKEAGMKICILSNTHNKNKVKILADKFNIPYIYFAKKPLKAGFLKAKELLELECESVAVVGDQIFTDVLGGNNVGMFSILIEPVGKQDIFITVIKRPLEKLVIRRYLKNIVH